ncbi:uncharacterized protein A1O9_03583 [Exophiala aquamarina CBS 119918]|uniref:FAD-binding PCMH-type domain-containing protein n=1 Tax=Exophiala aquamarina CBS 119918 TaxID=1182545 RepID=A0A072PQ56_9EURO|nr:uncharacterized protein A1O9_03583 [Exophiala aquamarina CBS 119918]KEF62011.1 hypothetical protein A1O9_03583 [Exophiala aquamarina CBS 119918]
MSGKIFSNEASLGGVSWHSNLYGWGCDNIDAYEVVLADGSVVTASKDSLPDLYKALQGGIANFGIITTFLVKAYPYTGMWAGTKAFEHHYSAEATKAFVDISSMSDSVEPKSFFILSLSTTEEKSWALGSTLIYCHANVNPTCFQATDIMPALVDDCRVRHQTECVPQLQAYYPSWMQYSAWTIATQVDLNTIRVCCTTWKEEMEPLLDEVEELVPVPRSSVHNGSSNEGAGRNGGNVIGLGGTQSFISQRQCFYTLVNFAKPARPAILWIQLCLRF